jgi:cytochrome P450
VFFSQYITHHMPELYPEPERFLPERWQTINPSVYEYLPFGGGPRMCIGATFALFEIKIALALILQRYRLALQAGARIDRRLRITLSPQHGMPMIALPPDQRVSIQRPRGNIHEMVAL